MQRRQPADRRDPASWQRVEEWVREQTDADFTHGVCPDCMRTLCPEMCPDRLPGLATAHQAPL